MVQKQINLTLNPYLHEAAVQYSQKFGFKNIQEMATEAIREKVFLSQNTFDSDLTEKERKLIELFIDKTLRKKELLATEKELDQVLG